MQFRKILRTIGVSLLVAFILIFGLSLILRGSFQFRMSDREVDAYFQSKGIEPQFTSYEVNDRTIFYASAGADTSQLIVFIHGTPGGWTNFINFLGNEDLINRYRMVSIERPGFGHSGFGLPESSLENQAYLLKQVLEKNRSENLPILVGHSIGGPIATKMMMLYPELIGSLILVAPSLDPDLEPSEPWREFLRWPVIRDLIPIAIYVSNEEIYFLKQQLTDMLPAYKDIVKPVFIVQGGDDFLVDPGNAGFASNVFVNADLSILYEEDADHFIPWTSPHLIVQAIDSLAK